MLQEVISKQSNVSHSAVFYAKLVKSIMMVFAVFSFAPFIHANEDTSKIAYENEGITVWKVPVKNSDMLGFKAQAMVEAPIQKVFELIKDVEHSNEWVPNTRNAKILQLNDKKGHGIFYFVLDMPFPLTDRDLVVDAKYTFENNGNIKIKNTGVVIDTMPEKEDLIRIKKYYGNWYLEKKGNDKTLVTLNGYANPEGGIPAWVANMFVTQQPYDMMRSMRKKLKQ